MADPERLAEVLLVQALDGCVPDLRPIVATHAQEPCPGGDPSELDIDDGRAIETRVSGDHDPGYGSTSRMLGEVAVCLLERPHDALPGGFWTPATAMGEALIERLVERVGLEFAVMEFAEV